MLILFVLLLGFVNLGVILYMFSLMSKSPFIPVPDKYLSDIIEALDLKDDSVLYDLGSGDGRVLFAAYEVKPMAKYIGVDINVAPIIESRIKKLLKGNPKNISFKKADIFKIDFSDATHVFTYLFDGPMADLLPIMQEQLKPGTKVVSCNFKLPISDVGQVILGHLEDKSARKLYIYEF
jgi:SAM-dependent methyltransferase